jgi:hypothetical protein
MKKYRNWIIGFVLTATAGAIALQNGLTQPEVDVPITSAPIITSTPNNEPCAYMWDYKNVPELTVKVEASVKMIDAEAKVRAQAYGENCGHTDGNVIFSAMETDVYIRITVKDLTDEEAFGNWMEQVLPLIVQIPENEFPGGYGFVEFWFEINDAEHVIVRVPIQEYLNTGQGKTGKELLQMFSNTP